MATEIPDTTPTDKVSPDPMADHIMGTYNWGRMNGSGLRQGFKCSCGWYISENDQATAKAHLEMELAVKNMNASFQKGLYRG